VAGFGGRRVDVANVDETIVDEAEKLGGAGRAVRGMRKSAIREAACFAHR
jgi:hypothetical protein